MWRVLSFKTIISQNLKDTPLSLSVHPQLSVIPQVGERLSECERNDTVFEEKGKGDRIEIEGL
jgi:hypothetical protein